MDSGEEEITVISLLKAQINSSDKQHEHVCEELVYLRSKIDKLPCDRLGVVEERVSGLVKVGKWSIGIITTIIGLLFGSTK